MKKISVVIPVYNTEKYLRKCFDSLVNQTYRDFVVIVVNDGSTDSSSEIINEYDKKYPHMFKVYNIENSGRASARNYGLKRVKTDFFTFLDSDDYLDNDTLLEFMRHVNDDVDVVVCNASRVVDGVETSVMKIFNDSIAELDKALMLSNPGPWGKLYRRKLFHDNDLKFPDGIRLYEDLGIMPLVGLYTNKVVYTDKPLYKYVIHAGSALRQEKLNDSMHDIFTIMDILKDSISNDYKEELEYLYIENLLRSASLRYIKYDGGSRYIEQISDIMHREYPKYQQNKYYKKANYRFKAACFLAYNKQYLLLKMVDKLNSLNRKF